MRGNPRLLGNVAEERNQVVLHKQVSWVTADYIKGRSVCDGFRHLNVCVVGQVELSGVCLINEGLEMFNCA